MSTLGLLAVPDRVVETISRRRWRPQQEFSPLAILANHFFGSGKVAFDSRHGGPKFVKTSDEVAPALQLFLAGNAFFEEGADLGCNRTMVVFGPFAEGFVKVFRDIFDVESSHRIFP